MCRFPLVIGMLTSLAVQAAPRLRGSADSATEEIASLIAGSRIRTGPGGTSVVEEEVVESLLLATGDGRVTMEEANAFITGWNAQLTPFAQKDAGGHFAFSLLWDSAARLGRLSVHPVPLDSHETVAGIEQVIEEAVNPLSGQVASDAVLGSFLIAINDGVVTAAESEAFVRGWVTALAPLPYELQLEPQREHRILMRVIESLATASTAP